MMDTQVDRELLEKIADLIGKPVGAFNIRKDCGCDGRVSTEHIKIDDRTDGHAGIDIRILDGTKGETCHIPVIITKSGVEETVYNDFYIGEGADVTVQAGCGVHSEGEEQARHNGIHRFFLEKNARVLYLEKHIATGNGTGEKRIDPVTDIELAEGASLEMDTVQLGGVTSTTRKTRAVLQKDARLVVRERIMTDGDEFARTDFVVRMEGEGGACDLVSRSVARGNSRQEFYSTIKGNAPCTGHSECDAILAENGKVLAQPGLEANHVDAQLIHEAAIGKIAGDQLLKLETLGLSPEEAEETILKGFLA